MDIKLKAKFETIRSLYVPTENVEVILTGVDPFEYIEVFGLEKLSNDLGIDKMLDKFTDAQILDYLGIDVAIKHFNLKK